MTAPPQNPPAVPPIDALAPPADAEAPPLDIRDVLNRRSDLSTFVVHLTKDTEDGSTARQNLESIIRAGKIEARTPMGWGKQHDDPSDTDQQTQRAVSFTETPLEHIYSHVVAIKGRSVKFEPYGVAMTKIVARRRGINPILYVDQTSGHDWEESHAINQLAQDAADSGDFHNQPIAKLLPLFEHMGTWTATGGTQKEFWWEREWRKRGDVWLPAALTPCLILCPEEAIDYFEEVLKDAHMMWRLPGRNPRRQCIDPRWGLERIIAHLMGLGSDDVTPFESN